MQDLSNNCDCLAGHARHWRQLQQHYAGGIHFNFDRRSRLEHTYALSLKRICDIVAIGIGQTKVAGGERVGCGATLVVLVQESNGCAVLWQGLEPNSDGIGHLQRHMHIFTIIIFVTIVTISVVLLMNWSPATAHVYVYYCLCYHCYCICGPPHYLVIDVIHSLILEVCFSFSTMPVIILRVHKHRSHTKHNHQSRTLAYKKILIILHTKLICIKNAILNIIIVLNKGICRQNNMTHKWPHHSDTSTQLLVYHTSEKLNYC